MSCPPAQRGSSIIGDPWSAHDGLQVAPSFTAPTGDVRRL
jgi:hypothetical protein